MAVEEKVEFEGEVMEALRGRMFRIQLETDTRRSATSVDG